VKQVYVYAIAHGEKVENTAESVRASSIDTFVPKDRALSPLEIRLVIQHLESVATYPTIRLALRLILLTLVRKSELIQATWDEVNFERATWTIPKQRMKGRNPHVVYPSCRLMMVLPESLPRKSRQLPHQQKMCVSDGKSDGRGPCRSPKIP